MVVALRREHDVFSAHARRTDVFSDDARSSNMSTAEKLVSASDDVRRHVQSLWNDIATVKAGTSRYAVERTCVHTARVACQGVLVCRGNVNAKSWSTLAECS